LSDQPENSDPIETISSGAVVDLVAFNPAVPGWATRCDNAVWLGAIGSQYLEPDPVPIRRSPAAWLKAGCEGICILTRDRAAAYHVLAGCHGLIAEDRQHAVELVAILNRRWCLPKITIRVEAPHAAE
jgi:hypothetical protein